MIENILTLFINLNTLKKNLSAIFISNCVYISFFINLFNILLNSLIDSEMFL